MMHRMEPSKGQQQPPAARHVHQTIVPALEAADAIVYSLVGVVFLFAALGMLGYSLFAFPASLRATGFALAVVTLVNDLLLVMIIMEVLRTVLSYLQERATSLQPFLFIAAISATRRILAIGAQMSVTGDTLSPDKFRQVMIDLGANAGAILAIALALYLLGRRPAESENSSANATP
jgi:uncharacterized membrane protein (DUF373 family)